MAGECLHEIWCGERLALNILLRTLSLFLSSVLFLQAADILDFFLPLLPPSVHPFFLPLFLYRCVCAEATGSAGVGGAQRNMISLSCVSSRVVQGKSIVAVLRQLCRALDMKFIAFLTLCCYLVFYVFLCFFLFPFHYSYFPIFLLFHCSFLISFFPFLSPISSIFPLLSSLHFSPLFTFHLFFLHSLLSFPFFLPSLSTSLLPFHSHSAHTQGQV